MAKAIIFLASINGQSIKSMKKTIFLDFLKKLIRTCSTFIRLTRLKNLQSQLPAIKKEPKVPKSLKYKIPKAKGSLRAKGP